MEGVWSERVERFSSYFPLLTSAANSCVCPPPYMGGDCSQKMCPYGTAWTDQPTATDTAHASAECSNMGICDRNAGVCICRPGFIGKACDYMDCTNQCNQVGRCWNMQTRAMRQRNSAGLSYLYNGVWDAEKIYGCVCDSTRTAFDCSRFKCPTGDDPMTKGQVNTVQLFKCQADSGSFVLYYNGAVSPTIPYNANQYALQAAVLKIKGITGIKVTYTLGNATSPVCSSQPQVVTIEFTEQFGPQPPLVPMADSAMTLAGGLLQVSADGKTVMTNPGSTLRYTSTVGTKENAECSNRGLCDPAAGTCTCYNTNGDAYDSSDGYGRAGTRGDCGFIKSGLTVSSCPGEVQCSGHGVCVKPSYTCACGVGWGGGDCSLRQCPTGLSWYDYPSNNNQAHATYEVCSGQGICDKASGACTCNSNFFGNACQYLNCPVDPSAGPCYGHGRCMSMTERALWATNNGNALVATYGQNPNNPLTWDGAKIFTCLCDPGYHGYDCSQRDCPTGNDPGTYNDHVEVQLLVCQATGGFFQLEFRQEISAPIHVNATALDVQEVLQAVPTLGPLTVYFARDGGIPNSTFNIVPPPLPRLQGRGPKVKFPAQPADFAFVTPSNPLLWNKNSTQYFAFGIPPPIKPNYTSRACMGSGQQTIVVQFDTIHGSLPKFIVHAKYLESNVGGNTLITSGVRSGNVKVYAKGQSVHGLTSRSGSTENAPCSNRGVCDEDKGVCGCYPAWSSSDGSGGPGDRGDCGYRTDSEASVLNFRPGRTNVVIEGPLSINVGV